jgi:15-cis-phytoene desaturase
MPRKHGIVAGGGLAGLSCAFELAKADIEVTVLEARSILGGRTSSWVDDGMPVESGLHKFLGVYRALPALLQECGAELADVITYVDELEIHHSGGPNATFTTAPFRHPLGTVASIVANNDLIPPAEKAKLAAMGTAGIARCISNPEELDRISIADYAKQFGISDDVRARVISTSTQAILFLPADRFSAYAAFAPIVQSVKHLMTARLAAFKGGMTEVMIEPIAAAIQKKGGSIQMNAPVDELLVDADNVVGLRVGDRDLRADAVVLALPLNPAKSLLRRSFGNSPWFQNLERLPSLSAATIQFELDAPLLTSDRTNFSSTGMCCFAEQSRTTFAGASGRLSAILYPPSEFIKMDPEHVLEKVYSDAESLNLPLRELTRRYRIVNHEHDFYAMEPGTEEMRPLQKTPIPRLALAGDYTRQPWSASMEGAVVSGRLAAEAVLATL